MDANEITCGLVELLLYLGHTEMKLTEFWRTAVFFKTFYWHKWLLNVDQSLKPILKSNSTHGKAELCQS
jgi:hypothetical protein